MLKEKSRYIPDIVTRDDIGGIDFPYGKDGKWGFGLANIIESRKNEKNSKYNTEGDFLVLFQKLAKTLESGELHEVKIIQIGWQ
ncbi:hypothetical protein LPTSP4_22700 [Leptospira ryugenii]|uniref:Uncharacterized protein n=1 Tax=Leptospira ryugenii TaxID=1917863 RepID=A0A2P2E1H6_9LEPT|nr:hypothetical protein [Leptospira ryugenii]GBF50743.1 hypothetical protein LPTSP4_22700 [Leptospira ryugenii]